MKSNSFLTEHIIGERVRMYRKKLGISQANLAKYIGVSAQQLQKYEAGKNKISATRLKQISQVLGVNINILLSEDRSVKYNTNPNYNKSEIERLIQNYLQIKSDKLRHLLIHSSNIYAGK